MVVVLVVVAEVVVVIIGGDVVIVVIVVINSNSNSHQAAEGLNSPLSPPRVPTVIFAAARSDGREGPGQECWGGRAPQARKLANRHRNQIHTTSKMRRDIFKSMIFSQSHVNG